MDEQRSGGGVTLRLFAALALPMESAAQLAEHAELIADRSPAAVAIEAPELHVTFAFLGDVPEEYLPALAGTIDAAAREVPGPTGCVVHGLSAYGNGRILAADVDIELLAAISSTRDRFLDAVMPYAIDVDRRGWQPHVSLLRTSAGVPLPPITQDDVVATSGVSWVASELRLYASVPGPLGALHRQIHAVPFGESVLHGRT
jgi:2'-5' RNA ligase